MSIIIGIIIIIVVVVVAVVVITGNFEFFYTFTTISRILISKNKRSRYILFLSNQQLRGISQIFLLRLIHHSNNSNSITILFLLIKKITSVQIFQRSIVVINKNWLSF